MDAFGETALTGYGKTILARETSGKGATGGTSEMGKTRGAQSVHVAPVALDVPVARLRALADCFSILLQAPVESGWRRNP